MDIAKPGERVKSCPNGDIPYLNQICADGGLVCFYCGTKYYDWKIETIDDKTSSSTKQSR